MTAAPAAKPPGAKAPAAKAPAADALRPVTERLRRDAEDQAAQIGAAARDTAADIRQRAHRDAAAMIDQAAATAAATADPLAAAELRRARDAARAATLSAQREAYDELCSRVRAAVAALPGQPDYEQLRQRIARLATRTAGPGARLTPEPTGGVVARSPGVIVDCSLDRLADLAVARLDAAIMELWTP